MQTTLTDLLYHEYKEAAIDRLMSAVREGEHAMHAVAENSGAEWRNIAGYEGRYQISSDGRVRSLTRRAKCPSQRAALLAGKEMTPQRDRGGYAVIMLSLFGKKKKFFVHRLIMAAFRPREDCQKMQVNHIDGNARNNSLDNLEWCTNSENRIHSYRVLGIANPMKGKKYGSNPIAKAVICKNVLTGKVKRYDSMSQTEVDGFRPKDVSAVCCGKRLTHYGCIFSYADNGGSPGPVYEARL